MFNLLLSYSIILKSLMLGEPKTCSLKINIEKIESDKGKLVVAIFNDEDTFLKKDFKSLSVPVDSSQYIIFNELPVGQYSISIFHDENENGELDTNWLGVPTEKFGFSNNKMGMFGPPSYKDCLISLDKEQTTVTIEMKKIF